MTSAISSVSTHPTMPSAKPPVGRASEDEAGTGSGKADQVVLSPLASALKGDALSLFSKLSSNDRSALGLFVSSGQMSSDEMNDALSGKLKESRSQTFWKSAVEAGVGKETERDKKIRTLTESIEARLSAIDKMASSGLSRDQAVAISKEMRGAAWESSSLMSQADEGATTVKLTAEFALNKMARTDSERAAGNKLTALGFKSESFDQLLTSTAKQDIASM
ncbi:hypothetical protein GAY28_09240 [Azospirillum brasilense]|uniref:hypothetical protein n=1 Tax=Azospirillum brasilense TaxID=192 RepID=UPI0011C3F840|nr:hypothetical protein [Azospirillum brasilense]NUB12877.1 hypothetical protein [Azospirillum brasilense]NUB28608.1 hypothetical protein [Azospirillum brasilense]NUB33829.1 hypothetical protein [Azospirillum brasilense]